MPHYVTVGVQEPESQFLRSVSQRHSRIQSQELPRVAKNKGRKNNGITNIYAIRGRRRPPEVIAFEHLQSEYRTLKSRINDDEAKSEIDELIKTKNGKMISWSELYFFELTLAQHLPVEKLRSKVMGLRYDYRSVAGQKEFDDYMAAKPPDLQSPPQPTDASHATDAHYEKLLRGRPEGFAWKNVSRVCDSSRP